MTTTPQLKVALGGKPLRFTMAQRKDFELELRVTNTGAATVDCKLTRSVLLIDGKPSAAWRESLNGMRDNRWRGLPPGETVTTTTTLGDEFFTSPGEHTLVLRVLEVPSAPLSVQITP